ncbi:hypothetical protein [Streptomyces melanogenes]|uniref:hypothetical protein n=1 Tax=Streptomyces melanogenes TaxID=67326 RepID=UPI0037A82FA0
MHGISIDANYRTDISARCIHGTYGMRKLLVLGPAEQWESALDSCLAMSWTSRMR